MNLLEYAKNNKNIYIYGNCERAYQVIRLLKGGGVEVEGIVISDGFTKDERDIPVYYINEIEASKATIIVALRYRRINELIPVFVEWQIKKVYFLSGSDLEKLQNYNDYYYKENDDLERIYWDWKISYNSSTKIFGYLLKKIKIQSVIDIGCGSGAWLKAIKDMDPSIKVLGVDGSDVDRSRFLQDQEFIKSDLLTFVHDQKYDLAMSLEVAEHLDEENADDFLDKLCSFSNVIVFSAAVKFQTGNHHVNEQPQSYWQEKFENRGYVCVDLFRPVFWNDSSLPLQFKQNMFLYVKDRKDCFEKQEVLFRDAIHPELFEMWRRHILDGTV